MKISKSGLLNLSLILTALGLQLMAVSIAERESSQLYIDLNNASQYMGKVKFISTWSEDSAFLNQIDQGSIKIEADNFILSQTWDKENTILSWINSSILWWIKNVITEWSTWNIIIGWSKNSTNGEYNVILWWTWNSIYTNSKFSVILGWSGNTITWQQVVALWSNNVIEDDWDNSKWSIVAWTNSYVEGQNSTALWQNSKVKANNSFLWNDGTTNETLTGDNLFVIMAKSGMIINTGTAHNFSKLTIWWPLILYSGNTDENIQCGLWNGGWILKIKNENDKMCLCSCDWSWRNSVIWKGKCISICNSNIEPICGDNVIQKSEGGKFLFSWSCLVWEVAKWIWSYLMDKNWTIHWSCQTNNGNTSECTGTLAP